MNNFQYLCIRKTSSVYESLDRHRQAGTPARGFQEPPGAARPPQPSHRQTAGNRQMDACCHTRHRHTSIIPHHRRISVVTSHSRWAMAAAKPAFISQYSTLSRLSLSSSLVLRTSFSCDIQSIWSHSLVSAGCSLLFLQNAFIMSGLMLI